MSPRFLDYKKAILSAISAVNLLAMVGIFAFTWFHFYLYQIGAPFYYRYGNWLFFFIYGISLYAITSVLGGYRIGRLRCSEIIYSNFLSLALANVFTFFIMALIARFWLPGQSHFNHDVGGICRGCHLVSVFQPAVSFRLSAAPHAFGFRQQHLRTFD